MVLTTKERQSLIYDELEIHRTQTIKLITIPQKTTVECDFKTDHSVDSITIGPSLSYIRR